MNLTSTLQSQKSKTKFRSKFKLKVLFCEYGVGNVSMSAGQTIQRQYFQRFTRGLHQAGFEDHLCF